MASKLIIAQTVLCGFFSFIINELERNERFKLKNVIVAGVSSSKSKPSRDQMLTMLTPIVEELKQLEEGKYFDLSLSENGLETLRVFFVRCNSR